MRAILSSWSSAFCSWRRTRTVVCISIYYVYIHIQTNVHIYIYMYTYMHTCLQTCRQTDIYIYIYIHDLLRKSSNLVTRHTHRVASLDLGAYMITIFTSTLPAAFLNHPLSKTFNYNVCCCYCYGYCFYRSYCSSYSYPCWY